MSLYGDMHGTEARGNYQYLGIGDYILSILEIKNRGSELKFIVELEVAEVLRAGDHQVGDTVSWLVNYGGDKVRAEMGRKDIRAFNDALIASAGGSPESWTQQQWEEFGKRCSDSARVSGIKVRARGERYVKKDGEEGKIPRMSWSSVKGQPRRPELVDVYGAAVSQATTAAPRSGPPRPGAAARHPAHADLVQSMREFLAAGQRAEAQSGSDLHAWALSEGMTEAQYAAAMAEAGLA